VVSKNKISFKKTVVILLALVLPISVSAGLVGAIANIFSRNVSAENIPAEKNIQNMALLVAVATPLSEGLSEPVNVEGNALVAEVGPSGTKSSPNSKPTSDQISVYVVHEGDTLSQIAEMFNVTVNTIKWGNDLKSNTLRVGETLVILPISGVRHTVVKGDTIDSLAKKYKGDKEEIIAYNNLKSSQTLEIGSIVIIPDGEVVPIVTSSISSGSNTVSSGSGLKEYVGYYLRPIVGGRKSQGIHGYNAIDIAAPVGTPIMASADGEVIISRTGGWNGGYGNYIVIKHANGTQTLYSHNNVNYVSAGDKVKQGEVIGTVGATGKVTGAHLHFEIRGAKNPF
jgi:LysM repeat protein